MKLEVCHFYALFRSKSLHWVQEHIVEIKTNNNLSSVLTVKNLHCLFKKYTLEICTSFKWSIFLIVLAILNESFLEILHLIPKKNSAYCQKKIKKKMFSIQIKQ